MPTDDDLIFVNGIDVETGSFLVDPMDFSKLASIIKGEQIDPVKAQDFKSIAQIHAKPSLGLPDGVLPTDVTKAGWALVLHKDEDPEVRKEMERLREHRRGQINDDTRVKSSRIRRRARLEGVVGQVQSWRGQRLSTESALLSAARRRAGAHPL